jgi:gluconate 5-dehydrogenase
MPDWLGLDGQRALVAGGAGTLGAAIVEGLLGAGAHVGVIDRDAERIERLQSACGGRPLAKAAADLRDGPSCRQAVAEVRAQLGPIDVAVHCVGVNDRRPIEEYGDADWEAIVATNLSSAFWLTQAVTPEMRRRRQGRLIFISSVAGRSAHQHHGPYAASKGALDQLMRVTAHESAGDGVTVNAVAPGYMDTALTEDYLAGEDGRRQALVELIPARRFGRLEEVVAPVLFLASPRASFITGHVLYVDGGRSVI